MHRNVCDCLIIVSNMKLGSKVILCKHYKCLALSSGNMVAEFMTMPTFCLFSISPQTSLLTPEITLWEIPISLICLRGTHKIKLPPPSKLLFYGKSRRLIISM